MSELPEGDEYVESADYVCDTYICERANFAPKIWAREPEVDQPRTTNSAEGFHRQYNASFTGHHPNIHVLNECLLDIQVTTYTKFKSIAAEDPPSGHSIVLRRKKKEKVVEMYQSMLGGGCSIYSYLSFAGFQYSPVEL